MYVLNFFCQTHIAKWEQIAKTNYFKDLIYQKIYSTKFCLVLKLKCINKYKKNEEKHILWINIKKTKYKIYWIKYWNKPDKPTNFVLFLDSNNVSRSSFNLNLYYLHAGKCFFFLSCSHRKMFVFSHLYVSLGNRKAILNWTLYLV